MTEAAPPTMLKRGEKCALPPALVFGGDKDEWVPIETMRSFVADYNKAGGEVELELYDGADHGFMTGKPNAPYAAPAIDRMKEFIRKHTSSAITASAIISEYATFIAEDSPSIQVALA